MNSRLLRCSFTVGTSGLRLSLCSTFGVLTADRIHNDNTHRSSSLLSFRFFSAEGDADRLRCIFSNSFEALCCELLWCVVLLLLCLCINFSFIITLPLVTSFRFGLSNSLHHPPMYLQTRRAGIVSNSGMADNDVILSFAPPPISNGLLRRPCIMDQRCFSSRAFSLALCNLFFFFARLDLLFSFLRGMKRRINPMKLALVPDFPAGAFTFGAPLLFLTCLAVQGPVALSCPQLHPPRFLHISTAAAHDKPAIVSRPFIWLLHGTLNVITCFLLSRPFSTSLLCSSLAWQHVSLFCCQALAVFGLHGL